MKRIFANCIVALIPHKEKRELVRKILTNQIKLSDISIDSKLPNTDFSTLQRYNIEGKNNKIIVCNNGKERELKANETIPGLKITINGKNNIIRIELPINATNSTIEIGNNNVYIDIGTTTCFSNTYIRCCYGKGQNIKIGKNTTTYGMNIICDADASCYIGEDCMFSNSIRIWCADGHSILDKDSGEILNKAKNQVYIGKHVWVGEGARITKKARIHDNSIIGGGAVAYKDYEEENVIIAGNPGKIVRRNITWDRRNPYNLEKELSK